MRRGAALLTAALLALLVPATAQGVDYVGLGDSYSSGTGTASDYADNCQRTAAAYPSLIDPAIPGTGTNLSCSGGRTQHIDTEAQPPGNTVAQLDVPGAVNPSTDVVTLQIGGNDAGFVDTLISCGNPFGDCDAAIEEAEQTATVDLPPKLNRVYAEVRATAPNATVAVVGYPRIFRPNQSCNTFFSASEVNDLNAAADTLSQIIKANAQARDLAYVDPRPVFIGHGACDSVEWINGLSFSQTANSYHPKAVGHSSGYAPLVLSTIQGIPNTVITAKPEPLSNTASPVFQFSSTPAAASFQCKLDSGSYAACTSPRQLSGVSEGTHTLSVRGVSAEGNVDQFPASHTWTVDLTAPGVAIDPGTGPAGTVADDTASFEFSSADGSAQLTCSLDGAAFEPCSSPRSFADLDDGEHTFTVRATDAAGNVSAAARTWTVDTTPPSANVVEGPSDPTASGDAELEFASDDPAAVLECRLDGPGAATGEFEPCSSPATYTGLADGDYSFTVRATDAVGNQSVSDPYAWTVDSTASTATIDSGPDPLTNDPTPQFTFTVDDPTATVECDIDGGGFSACASGDTFGPLGDGEHTFTVRATDSASNVATDSYSWEIDTQAPPAEITSGPPAATASTDAELVFSSTDAGAEFECSLDAAPFAPCESPETLAALGNGSHTFRVRATDDAGNTGPEATRTWTVDTIAPTASIPAGTRPPAQDDSNSGQIGFESNEPGSTFECRLDSGAAEDFQPCGSPQPYSGLADGAHTFDVRATDAVGNQGPATSFSWTVDTTPPTVTVDSGPPVVSNTSGGTFSFSSSEPNSTFECRLDSGEESAFTSCSPPRSYTNLADGPHTLEVRATDSLGNRGTATAYSWNSDTLAPNAQIDTGPQGQVKEDDATFTFSASEEGDFECRIDGGTYLGCAATETYEDLADGAHTFQVRFTDAGGRSVTDSRTFTVDTVAPAVDITAGPAPLTRNASATFTFNVSGGSGSPQCLLDGVPVTPCTSPKNVIVGDGGHTFKVVSTDAAGNEGSEEVGWTVDTVAPDTGIDSAPPAATTATSAAIAFSSGDGSAAFQCSLDGEPFAGCTSPVSLSGLSVGDHSFRVRATDPAGNVDGTPAQAKWTVQAPSIIGPGMPPDPVKPSKKCKKPKKGKKAKKGCKRKRKKG